MKHIKSNAANGTAQHSERFVREADLSDLDFLFKLESASFSAHRRSSHRSLRNSILSPAQLVYVVGESHPDGTSLPAGAATLILYKRTIRIYSVAVLNEVRQKGFGELMINRIIEMALQEGYDKISLEADESNTALVEWYQKFGFAKIHFLPDYYRQGEPACRMILSPATDEEMAERIVAVVEDETRDALPVPGVRFCSANKYLS